MRTVRPGALAQTLRPWWKRQRYSSAFLIADENTARECHPVLEAAMGFSIPLGVTLPAGEQHKTLESCSHIWEAMQHARLDRKALVVLLGGGVVGDMGGFCAATYMRGLDYIQIPTTLMAMTDSSIGGKLGIDFLGVKNNIGVFGRAKGIFPDPVFLKTLPERELRSGFAEVAKHAIIGDPGLWQLLQQVNSCTEMDWNLVLPRSMAVKQHIVHLDPKEKNLRKLLNFGHTLGHALESHFLRTDTPMLHGEAVAWGMVWEAQLAWGTGERALQIRQFVEKHFPPLPYAPSREQMDPFLRHDKKNGGNQVWAAIPGDEPFSLRLLPI